MYEGLRDNIPKPNILGFFFLSLEEKKSILSLMNWIINVGQKASNLTWVLL